MYASDLIIGILIILNLVGGIIYFSTRDSEWLDIPIISSLFSAGCAWIVAGAILGQFTNSSTGYAIVYAGLGIMYVLVALVMSGYFAAEFIGALYYNIIEPYL